MVKNLQANAGDARDVGLIPGLGRSPGGGNGNLLQYSCLENPMDRGGWWATVCGVSKSWTQGDWAHTWLAGHTNLKLHEGICKSTLKWKFIGSDKVKGPPDLISHLPLLSLHVFPAVFLCVCEFVYVPKETYALHLFLNEGIHAVSLVLQLLVSTWSCVVEIFPCDWLILLNICIVF